MTRPLMKLTLVAGMTVSGAALADDDCTVPMADWQPQEAVQRMAETQGWSVRRIKTDDGCYEIDGRDAEGREIEVKVDPATLAIVELEYEDDEDEDDDEVGAMTTTPRGSATPPDNGLFVPGSAPKVESR